MLRSLSVSGLAVMALTTGLLHSSESAHAEDAQDRAISSSESVTLVDSTDILPTWAGATTATGAREVWLLPFYGPDDTEWSAQNLLDQSNSALSELDRASGGQLTATATQVLEPHYYQDADGSLCNGLSRVSSPLRRDLGDTLAANPDVHIVLLAHAPDCPFAADGETPGQWIRLVNVSREGQFPAQTLLHEFGHNLGLPHAGGYTNGGALSWEHKPGVVGDSYDQYGDRTAVMGSSRGGSAVRGRVACRTGLGRGRASRIRRRPQRTYSRHAPTPRFAGTRRCCCNRSSDR